MRAMKQVVPGHDLWVSYMSNSRAVEVEGAGTGSGPGRYYPPVPFLNRGDNTAVVRHHAGWRERFALAWKYFRKPVTTRGIVVLTFADMLNVGPDFPDLSSAWEFGISRLNWSKLSWPDRLRFLATGDIWQLFRAGVPDFVPYSLTARCPISVKKEREARKKYPDHTIRVAMSGRDQRDETGIADVVSIRYHGGKYSVDGAGEFDTDSEAIEAAAGALREKNRRKWNNAMDAKSLSGGEHKIHVCLECGGRLGKRDIHGFEVICGNCGKKFSMRGGFDDNIELTPMEPARGFRERARDAGFSLRQVELMEEWLKQDREKGEEKE